LSVDIKVNNKDEIGIISEGIKEVINRFSNVVTSIKSSSAIISGSREENND